MRLKLGVTGTREGMNYSQRFRFSNLMRALRPILSEFHHGGCVGVDVEVHELVMINSPSCNIIVHPPLSSNYYKKNLLNGEFKLLEPKPYLERNQNIVDACDMLIVVPKTEKEELRSGTWATYRYAKKKKKPIIMLHP